MIKKQGHSMCIDWYLLGVVLYELLEGLPPYYSEEKDELMNNILEKPLNVPHHISDEAKDLLEKLLIKDPEYRLGSQTGADEVKNHPWFASVDWEQLMKKKECHYPPYLYKSKEELIHEVTRSKPIFNISRESSTHPKMK